MYMPRRFRLTRSLGLLISFAILLSCLVSPSAFPGRLISRAESHPAPMPTTNFIDNVRYFVRQHYLDFLSREPDPAGWDFWTNQITSCGNDTQCAEAKKINVSAAFFISIEFQESGYLVYRLYKAAYGNIQSKPVPITRSELMLGSRQIGLGVRVGIGNWQQQLEDNKRAFAAAFVTDERFTTKYPTSMSAAQFVDTINTNTGGVLSTQERNTLINGLNGGQMTRAQVLRTIADNQTLRNQEFRKAFVLLQYFGYLGRNPDAAPDSSFNGYNFWLNKLNQFNGDFVRSEMVKAFLVSGEYRQRFAQPHLSAFSNPADPQLVRVVTARGDVLDYFGQKNAAGQATALRSVRVTNAAQQTTNISLDSQSRLSRIQAFNGTEFKITWVSNTNIVITALSADGAFQVNVPVDLVHEGGGSASSSCCGQLPVESDSESQWTNRTPRGGRAVELNVTQADSSKSQSSSLDTTAAGTSLVNVKRCGTAVDDATVAMTVIPTGNAGGTYTIPGSRTGAGQYSVSIPTQPSPGQEAEDICGNIADVIGVGCDVLATLPPGAETQFCATIGSAISKIPHPAAKAAGAAVFAACEGAFFVARLTCDTIGFSPGEPGDGMPSLLDGFCDNISELVDRFFGGEVRLVPVVFVPGKGIINTGSGSTAPANGPFPSFTVDPGDQVEIVSFTTSPADPAPSQGYVATAVIHCAPPNTRVTISISGTDGYSDSATSTIQGDVNVTLSVPGAAAGVVDTVRVAITNGPSRQVVLVF